MPLFNCCVFKVYYIAERIYVNSRKIVLVDIMCAVCAHRHHKCLFKDNFLSTGGIVNRLVCTCIKLYAVTAVFYIFVICRKRLDNVEDIVFCRGVAVKGNVKIKPAISPMCEPLKLFRIFFVLLYCSVHKIVVVLRG